MKIWMFELWKAGKAKAFWYLALACILGNLLYLWYSIEDELHRYHIGLWREVENTAAQMEPEEAYRYLDSEAGWYSYLTVRSDKGGGSESEQNWYRHYLTDPYPETDWDGRLADYLAQAGEDWDAEYQDWHERYYVCRQLAERYKYMLYSYPEFLPTVREQAERMSKLSVFTGNGTFADRNREKTIRDYAALEGLVLGTDYSAAVVAGTENLPADGIMLILVAAFAWIVWRKEREDGLYPLLRGTRNGRRRLALEKLCAYGISLSVLAAGLYGSQLLLAAARYGIGNLSLPLQSIPEFRNCTFKITIGHYLLYFCLIKLAAVYLYGGLCMVMMSLRRHFALAVGAILAVSAAESALWQYVDNLSAWNVLKYVNLFAVMDVQAWFSTYYNLNLFSWPVSAVAGRLALIPVGCTVFSLTVVGQFCGIERGVRAGRRTFGLHVRQQLQRIPSAMRLRRVGGGPAFLGAHRRAGLFGQEGYKLYVVAGMSAAALCMMAGSFRYATGITQYVGTTATQSYRYYIQQIGGEYTQKVSDYLAEEEKVLAMEDEEALEIQRKREEGSISSSDYENWMLHRNALIIACSEGFGKVRLQEKTVLAAQEKWGGAGFADVDQIAWLFERDQRQLVMALCYLAVIILGVSGLEGMEYRTGMRMLNRTTVRGRRFLQRAKILQTAVFALLLYAVLYVPYYVRIWGDLARVDTDLLLQGIPGYENFPVPISIAGAVCLVLTVRCVLLVSCSMVAGAVTRLVRDTAMGCFVGAVLLLLPIIFCLWGMSASAWSLAGSVLPELALRSPNPAAYFINWACVAVCGTVSVFGWRK